MGAAATAVAPATRKLNRLGDEAARLITAAFAATILLITVLLVYELWIHSDAARAELGLGVLFFRTSDPVTEQFGALPFIYGTALTSFLALLISVPLGVGAAIFLSELAPDRLSSALTFLVELLAAVPSVIYGLLAIFTLVPLVRSYIGPALQS